MRKQDATPPPPPLDIDEDPIELPPRGLMAPVLVVVTGNAPNLTPAGNAPSKTPGGNG